MELDLENWVIVTLNTLFRWSSKQDGPKQTKAACEFDRSRLHRLRLFLCR
jgi:hypothetical protein